jgi:hypothetical protein
MTTISGLWRTFPSRFRERGTAAATILSLLGRLKAFRPTRHRATGLATIISEKELPPYLGS